ncbi:MAG: hypothetical protein A2Z86_04055 [Candidatus Glassbacteria bacterium GWA2_58_10]|uniref:TIGR00297 family protein n=1 Tax=Candidatus Glassbacteria bacterium GWA2_58_10 TaxID=1817865 RepID=A0A1F5YEI4_9BACT|nr:MAG: hypothetical protein A2Z86_04055 [Candidatus Glassbacteria bacterium GWA2_58_10]
MYFSSYPLIEAIAVTLVFGLSAYFLGTVSKSGLAGGVVIGALIYYCGGWPSFTVLGAFFILASLLTRAGYRRKQALGAAQESGGKRGARHAAANCAVGLLLAVAYKLSGADPLAGAAFVASFATAAADTAGSETGPLIGRITVLPTSFKKVSPGTPGAVSLEGTLVSLAAAGLIALTGRLVGLADDLGMTAAALSGFAAAFAESLLGSFPRIERSLGNEGMNLLNTALGAIFCLTALILAR